MTREEEEKYQLNLPEPEDSLGLLVKQEEACLSKRPQSVLKASSKRPQSVPPALTPQRTRGVLTPVSLNQ
ncbi:hypothetical protein EYF80_033168 [Liparis tanakae]|uniref:Uncharacterized protein n=1 Tax=Liparis tanakae TaxID=230148 RepID=A0A4Z2GTJ7_9TELE|nr:hypothetical protein EYF80_033168 [Liparis tanakae]